MTVAGVLLAAGEGSRFAASVHSSDSMVSTESVPPHKLLVDFRGRPLAAWAVEALLTVSFDQSYLVTGSVDLEPALTWLRHNRRSLPLADLTLVTNKRWSAGQATSIGTALDRAIEDGHQAVVIGLADQPLVPASAWSSVADGDGPIVVATFAGERRPPVKLDRSVWPRIPRVGDAGARSVIRAHPELVSEVPCLGNPVDIDTVKDLRAWS